MTTVFIISEYNPFHNGHAWQIEKIREELQPDAIVSIMSGNFLQRGTPAILDKFRRADLAVLGGCDLVVELPAVYAVSSAEFFATGGVKIAQGLDPKGILSFGSESGDALKIITAARLLKEENDALDREIREELDKGYSYPKARLEAFRRITGDPHLTEVLQSPNNILAVEYVRAALETGSTLSFHTVKRKGLGYHEDAAGTLDPSVQLPSATAIRNALRLGDRRYPEKAVPESTRDLFLNYLDEAMLGKGDLLKELLSYRLHLQPEALRRLPEAGDGLAERILSHRGELSRLSLQEFSLKVKTRRFTYTRIRRLLIHLALGFDELPYADLRRETPEYARILALNPAGQKFLARTRMTRTLKLIQSAREISGSAAYRPDQNASYLYSLLNPAYPANADYTHQLKIMKPSGK